MAVVDEGHPFGQCCIDAGMMRQKIPERLELVATLPRNPAGKIEKRILRERYGPTSR